MLLLILSVCFVLALVCIISRRIDKPFFLVFFFTTLYYSAGSYWYWGEVHGGYFLYQSWNVADIAESALILALSSLLVAIYVQVIKLYFFSTKILRYSRGEKCAHSPVRFYFVVFVGLVASTYTLASAKTHGSLNRSDPFILIAYQFSDILIPAIIFSFATKKSRFISVLLFAFFLYYAMSIGFRYKIFLVIVPLILVELFSFNLASPPSLGTRLKRIIVALIAAVLVVNLFSFMTLARKKFNSVEFSSEVVSEEKSKHDELYGFFAEGNTIIGLTAVKSIYLDAENPPYIYFQPFLDTVLELIPRALAPWRQTNISYLVFENALGDRARGSGTAYPYAGEYITMGGWIGILLGCFYYAGLYSYFSLKLDDFKSNAPIVSAYGSTLLAAFFGYYFYARGYSPQVLKGVIFVVIPYFFLMKPSPVGSGK